MLASCKDAAMPMIKTRDGTLLRTKIWGTGRPVILLHGWPLSSDTWDDHAMAIAENGMQAIAYDRRGFGRSDQPWLGYDYDSLADDLADVIKETGANDATLVGFSMGGGEVARYMSRHRGEHVKQIALIASVVPYMPQTEDNPNGTPKSVFADMAEQMQADRAKFFGSFFDTFYGVGILSQPVSDEVLQWSFNLAMMAGLKPTLACAQAFSSTDFRPDLGSIRVPTLIIHGTSDQTVPIDASARAAAAAIPTSRLLEYSGAPHGLLVTHKEKVTADLLHFLRES